MLSKSLVDRARYIADAPRRRANIFDRMRLSTLILQTSFRSCPNNTEELLMKESALDIAIADTAIISSPFKPV